MNQLTWNELETFVRRKAGVSPKETLTKCHAIEGDLDITGDDAVEFMESFFEKFPVQVGDFDFNRYFSGEGFSLIEVALMAFSRKRRAKYDKVPLTLGMLYQAILDGEWNNLRLESLPR
ncbi:acyl carrier protein [Burkholderia lata]|uniref:Acyl carrier protein n=1 Tax=Burkholderia lata (strain ATCC 17760 / DSM 23089 / LMG 22485 / NCIMB 9086 / R18194 / 383) TaxID=482957 RepID=A0A6P2W775_BURL3|nr:DUF1493 family protein [Burkholderia lata]VWC21580.1 acyl carrier protein [Burkholderia lata]VWC87034.1 acyl carrier protein [Burkholderia lata]